MHILQQLRVARTEFILFLQNIIESTMSSNASLHLCHVIKSKWNIFYFDWPWYVDMRFWAPLKFCFSAGEPLNMPDSFPVRSQRGRNSNAAAIDMRRCGWIQENARAVKNQRHLSECGKGPNLALKNNVIILWTLDLVQKLAFSPCEGAVKNSSYYKPSVPVKG